MQTSPTEYPTRAGHAEAWAHLAREIAALKNSVSEQPVRDASTPIGELTVIGSGIESIGFTLGDEDLILSADKVFYCVADPATAVWIKQRRPDAFDLYVLYDDKKIRYTTYMQMAEAQLYYVRQGLKVVAIFYGHPGVFVLSTHRAIQIARREGHRARMKAAVSALDCLCADLGVDPSQPGLQTHEATDMMIRSRVPDTGLHVVLWQVGLIGELGFRRQGYVNANFSHFIQYLQDAYGPDYPVTHYIASRYPTIEPLIETYTLEQLHNPDTQMSITGLSTFYLPPKTAAQADQELMRELGLLKDGQTVRNAGQPLREITRYTHREMEAFRDFAHFSVPNGYQWQAETPASRFLIQLQGDPELQQRYTQDPKEALRDPRFANLSARERSLLATRDPGALQIAAKGIAHKESSNYSLVMKLLGEKATALALVQQVKARTRKQARLSVSGWAEALGFPIVWGDLENDINFIHQSSLFAWTGVYLDHESGSTLFTILGTRGSSQGVLFAGEDKLRFTFSRGCLRWTVDDGNPHNGFLRLTIANGGLRHITGKLWGAGEAVPARYTVMAEELDPQRASHRPFAVWPMQQSDLAQLAGDYVLSLTGSTPRRLSISPSGITIGEHTTDAIHFSNGVLAWENGPADASTGKIHFLLDPICNTTEFYGTVQAGSARRQQCYGAAQSANAVGARLPALEVPARSPAWAWNTLGTISRNALPHGGLCLWHRWEKQAFIGPIVNKLLVDLI